MSKEATVHYIIQKFAYFIHFLYLEFINYVSQHVYYIYTLLEIAVF